MSTTLGIESFSEVNIKERSALTVPVLAGAEAIVVANTQGYVSGDIIYVGQLSRETCEKAVVASVVDETTVGLVDPLKLPHGAFEPVASVLGDLIHIYRAANIDGRPPADDTYTVLATRSIDSDQLTTYYTDSNGDSNFWYRSTYYNATTNEETDLADSVPVRGDDFGHYASISEIREEAGFSNNFNLKDTFIDQQRRAAEAEINTTLSNAYTVPFTPVPEVIHTLTIKLAAGLLMQAQYPGSSRGNDKLSDARAQIKSMQNREQTIVGDDGISIAGGTVTFWPDEDQPRAFTMGDRF